MMSPHAEPDAAPVPAELRARRLVLEDRRGQPVLILGPNADGEGLVLTDPDGRPRVQLVLDRVGASHLKLHDKAGEVCAWLSIGVAGTPSLWLRAVDPDGRVRGHAELQVDGHGCAALSLHDRDGRARALLRLAEDGGRPSLAFSDEHGVARLVVTQPEAMRSGDGVPRLGLVAPAPPAAAAAPPAAQPLPEPAAPPAEVQPPADDVAAAPRVPDAEVPDVARVSDAEIRHELLAARVTRLEAARARRPLLVAAGLCAAAALGAVGGRLAGNVSPLTALLPRGSAPAEITRLPDRLAADEITLRGPDGTARARLALAPGGWPFLELSGPDGRSAAQLALLPEGSAALRLAAGEGTIALDATRDDVPSVGLWRNDRPVFQAPASVSRFPPPQHWR